MREAATVLSDASSLTTTEQPLTFSTRLMTVRVTSRSVMEFFCSQNSIGESRFKAACPFFLFTISNSLIQTSWKSFVLTKTFLLPGFPLSHFRTAAPYSSPPSVLLKATYRASRSLSSSSPVWASFHSASLSIRFCRLSTCLLLNRCQNCTAISGFANEPFTRL